MTRKSRVLYAGVNLEEDLRAWLKRLARDLLDADQKLREEERLGLVKLELWNGAMDLRLPHDTVAARPRSRLRDAANVIDRASRLASLAELFPEQLAHRRRSGRHYWMVVDAIDAGEANRKAVAKRWNVTVATLAKHVRECGDAVRKSQEFPLDPASRAELHDMASKEFAINVPRRK